MILLILLLFIFSKIVVFCEQCHVAW